MATWVRTNISHGQTDRILDRSFLASPSPWPNIQERAQLARVPIMMYHDILPQKEVFFDVTPRSLRSIYG